MATVVFPEIGNGGIARLDGAINNSVTTINVDSATALTLDNSTSDAYIVLIDASTYRSNPIITAEVSEICLVTGVSTNALTVVRGQDGSSAKAFSDNDIVELRVVAATIERIYDALTDGNDTLNFPGVTGDFEVGGDLTLGASGVNKAWTKYIPITLFHNISAGTGTITASKYNTAVLDFDDTADELCNFECDLGDDYDDSSLDLTVWWSAAATSGACRWYIEWDIIAHNDPLAFTAVVDSGNFTVVGTATEINKSVITLVPTGTGKQFFVARFRRNAASGSDGLSGDARLIGVSLSYT